MGCNCGKNRRTAQQAAAEQAKTPQANQLQTTQGNTTPPPAPKQAGGRQSFALQFSNGQTIRFGSRLEAEAENVRRGYTGTIRSI